MAECYVQDEAGEKSGRPCHFSLQSSVSFTAAVDSIRPVCLEVGCFHKH